MKELICGIYMITSPSGKIYVGQSVDINSRWSWYELGHCKKQIKLSRSFNKYGVENHKFQIICKCEELQLDYLEKYLIRFYDTFNTNHGLNLKEGGANGRASEETKSRMSLAHNGKKFTKDHIEKLRLVQLGRKHTEEHKKKVGEASKGRKLTDEHKKILSEVNKGKKMSKESRQKMSIAAIGRPGPNKGKKRIGFVTWNKGLKDVYSEDVLQRMSDSRKGKKLSEETKRKMSESRRGKKASLETRQKMSKSSLGRRASEETKQKIRENKIGRKASDQTREKMRNSHKDARERIRQEKLTMIF